MTPEQKLVKATKAVARALDEMMLAWVDCENDDLQLAHPCDVSDFPFQHSLDEQADHVRAYAERQSEWADKVTARREVTDD